MGLTAGDLAAGRKAMFLGPKAAVGGRSVDGARPAPGVRKRRIQRGKESDKSEARMGNPLSAGDLGTFKDRGGDSMKRERNRIGNG